MTDVSEKCAKTMFAAILHAQEIHYIHNVNVNM